VEQSKGMTRARNATQCCWVWKRGTREGREGGLETIVEEIVSTSRAGERETEEREMLEDIGEGRGREEE
jgi:hypothetical protein